MLHIPHLPKATFLVLFLFVISAKSQTDTIKVKEHSKRKREAIVYSGIGVFYTGLGYGLYNAWYKNYPFQKFHYFNDGNEWLQMDKLGHAFTCYAEGVNGMELMSWVGLSEKKSVWVGGMIGFGVQTIVEVMDGRSARWGFSWGDMCANTLGTSLAISQQLLWKEQRIQLRISVHQTDLAKIRPDLLGDGLMTSALKDYNGQTYWLSVDVKSFMPQTHWPPWLNMSVGYGAYGMLTGSPGNTWTDAQGVMHDYSSIARYRQFYFAPDINLEKIPYIKRHKVLYRTARFLSFIKVPMPALQFDRKGIRGWGIYF